MLAPLWRLFAYHRAWSSELKKHWARLANGDYDWAQLAMRLWPERVVPKCAEDRSLAIAHGLEDVFWMKDPANEDKWLSSPYPRYAHRAAHCPTPQPGRKRCNPTGKQVTNLLHVYIAEQLAQHVNNHRVVVWYDPRSEFERFVSELGGTPLMTVSSKQLLGGQRPHWRPTMARCIRYVREWSHSRVWTNRRRSFCIYLGLVGISTVPYSWSSSWQGDAGSRS